jgi:undecaprenyl diphosphate synthase
MILNFALSYGGRAEIVHAIKNIIEKKIPVEKINEETIKNNLWLSDVDLIIRTGKEQRISNFLIWQGAYSELYFSPKYWPDFSEKDLDLALAEYDSRKRRFGS